MRKIGINIGLKRGLDIEEAIKKIKELGFDSVFCGVPPLKQIPQMAKALAENGLEWETLHAPFGHMNDIWLEGEAGEIMLRELLNCVDCCAGIAGAKQG